MSAAAERHIPVLIDPVLAALDPQAGEAMVDGTFGNGGYTAALLARGAKVYAFDRDPDAIAHGQAMVADAGGALALIHARFSGMDGALADRGVAAVDGVALDLGVSSMQLDQADRGFSRQQDGPLDMRMEREGDTAADYLNSADEGEIADVIHLYGEEPRARRVARAIVAARPIERTLQLTEVIHRALGFRPGEKKDPAPRIFQAIRILLNQEMEELEQGLEAAEKVLAPGGRLAVVSFHSIEDRIVKRFLRERSGATPAGSRHRPLANDAPAPSFEAVAKPVRPDEAELARNPRARSATLRVARRTSASPWSASKKGPVR